MDILKTCLVTFIFTWVAFYLVVMIRHYFYKRRVNKYLASLTKEN